ncbi:MAG: putative Ig domain-containing protein [Kiritimatiellae bacterium]|nr:putative Ig domain-containing protein [Kiritimatiellia bacterium]
MKIWDSDKTTFRGLVTHQSVSYVYDGTSHTLQPAVGAEGDEVFRYALSEEGPFVEEMPTITDAGTISIWYEVEAEGETTRDSATVTVTKRPLTFTSASAQKPYDGIPLSATNVLVSGGVPQGEGFAFSVTGSQTIVGESVNAFTWSVLEGTNPDNYEVTTVCGILKVVMGAVNAGTEYEIIHGETDAVRITRLPYPNGGNVTLPSTLGGLPVAEIAAGALAGTSVTGVRVPSGVVVSGALFENLPNVSNVTLDAGCALTGALSCRGSAALQEVIVPASVTELAPHAFLGCWALERVVFAGEPPFGNNTDATAELALLTASVRPATLLQMADMICYPVACAAKWEKSLRNLGYGGKYGAYEAEWTGLDSLIADSGNLNKDSGGSASPTEQPAAHYAAQTGVASGTAMPGTAGWDAFGVPDGMTWDRETGTLVGTPKRSGTYDVILVSGSGADTKMMRTTVDVAGYAVTTGYVGTAFKASGAPWNALASYKTAPKGLKWKNKVLSGVPTKAGTTTYKTKDGEPVKVAILALPVGAKGTFNGVLQDGAGKQYPLKVSATAAGKLTATVTKGTKSYSLSAVKWSKVTLEPVDGATHRMFAATLTASGLSLSVKVDADAAWNADVLTAVGTQGAVKNLTGTAQRNAYASDVDAQGAAAARAGTFALAAISDGAGGWTLAPPEEGVKGPVTLTLKATGAATLTGTLPNKAKVSASSTLHVDTEGTAAVRFYVSGKWITWQTAL